jgi:hypothetical protein
VSERGIWFYSALAALLLGSLLVTPFFTKPADAISYGVAALVSLLAANVWGSPASAGFDRFTWSSATLYVMVVLVAGLLAIGWKDSSRPLLQKSSRALFLLADALGQPRAIFSVVFFFALSTYHRSSPREYLVIGVAWAVFVGLKPLEGIADLFRRWRAVWGAHSDTEHFGQVVGHEAPGLVLVREEHSASASFGDLLVVRTEGGQAGIAVALDHVGFAEGCWLRAYHLSDVERERHRLVSADVERAVVGGMALRLSKEAGAETLRNLAEDVRERLLGLVAPETNVGCLHVELVRHDLTLRQGSLLEVTVANQPVLYQVIAGVTKEEILHQKNSRGFVQAQARKVGAWNEARRSFESVPWLPTPNAPVRLVRGQDVPAERDAVGHFPGTRYPVRVDPQLLVTHNAAILGILGVGKTFLALELVERMIAAGIKVICLDLTDQYAAALAPFLNAKTEQQSMVELQEIGVAGRTKAEKNVEEGGSVRQFRARVKEQLESFLAPNDPRRVRIVNPVRFEVWRQDSKPYQGQASMASLTPTEVTRIFTEATLEILQAQGMTDRARCCIVYEEAHSLVPEWNAVASEGDKVATNGTAKAILQGRKFGLGCLVVTQRTANVTKSILNQCNTVFGLRVFDATGVEFLKNYFGEEYADVLSTLDDRHAVVFGRSSSCRDPVLIRLNDREQFIRVFREAGPATEEGREDGDLQRAT